MYKVSNAYLHWFDAHDSTVRCILFCSQGTEAEKINYSPKTPQVQSEVTELQFVQAGWLPAHRPNRSTCPLHLSAC